MMVEHAMETLCNNKYLTRLKTREFFVQKSRWENPRTRINMLDISI